VSVRSVLADALEVGFRRICFSRTSVHGGSLAQTTEGRGPRRSARRQDVDAEAG
jgi:hypothetical protein